MTTAAAAPGPAGTRKPSYPKRRSSPVPASEIIRTRHMPLEQAAALLGITVPRLHARRLRLSDDFAVQDDIDREAGRTTTAAANELEAVMRRARRVCGLRLAAIAEAAGVDVEAVDAALLGSPVSPDEEARLRAWAATARPPPEARARPG